MCQSYRSHNGDEGIIIEIESLLSFYISSIILCNGFPHMPQANSRPKKYYKKCWQLFSAEQHALAQSQLVLTVT